MPKTNTIRSISIVLAASIIGIYLMNTFSNRSNVPAIAVGHSMAPTIYGVHFVLECPQCDAEFSVDSIEAENYVPCTHCDETISPENARFCRPGKLSLLHSHYESLQRGDLVAIRDPIATNRLLVKRIVGLPGDVVDINRGSLQINSESSRALGFSFPDSWSILTCMQ